MRYPAWDEIFPAGFHRYPFSIDDNGVAPLDDNHVLIEIMSVRCGCCGLAAVPKCHLTTIRSVKDVPLDPRCRLMGRRYSVCGVFHKRGKVIHNAHSFTRRVNDGDDLLAAR